MLKQGMVFHYPFLWRHQHAKGIEHAKDRTCCLAFKLKNKKFGDSYIILSISDQRGDSEHVMEVPAKEKRKAGLDTFRKAYLHLSELNVEPSRGSFNLSPQPKILGQFGEAFMDDVSEKLAICIRAKAAVFLTRR